MPIEKAPHWTDLYYRFVEHYFWRPQDIGRIANPDKPSRQWGYWLNKLESQETPLNHILDLLFHIAPQELLDEVVSSLLGRRVRGLELVHATADVVDPNIVQPDIILVNESQLVFIEMKVDSKSSLDQYAKYAIAALNIRNELQNLESTDLVILSRQADHQKVWRGARKLGLDSTEKVKRMAAAGLRDQETIWRERGVPRYLASHPEQRDALATLAEAMTLHLVDYSPIALALQEYVQKNNAFIPFVNGVLHEFRKRTLIA